MATVGGGASPYAVAPYAPPQQRKTVGRYYGQVQTQPWWAQAQPLGPSYAMPQRPEGGGFPGLPGGGYPGPAGGQPLPSGFTHEFDPYAGSPLQGSDAERMASRLYGGNLLYNLSHLGYLVSDPSKSPLTEAYRQQAAQTSQAQQRRAQLAASTLGLPQGQQGYAWLQAMLGGQGAEARGVNSLMGQQYQQQQDFARQLALALTNYSPASKYRGPTDWSGILGGAAQLGGAALGGAFGGPAGAAIGGSIGGGLPTMGQPGFQYPYYGG